MTVSPGGGAPRVPTGGRRSRPYAPPAHTSETHPAGLRLACRLKPAFQAVRATHARQPDALCGPAGLGGPRVTH